MAEFLAAFGRVLQAEGGYVNDPHDRGGETKYGISRRQYPTEDIYNLTLDHAAFLYRKDYWEYLELDLVKVQAVAEEIFDTAVNMGPARAVRILQESLNWLGSELVIDGKMGPNTRNALNAYRYPESLLKVLNGVQFDHYQQIVEEDPEMARYFRGWMRRVEFG